LAVEAGPVAVALDASSSYFQWYKYGILNTPLCGSWLNHAVLIVGYGMENGNWYWIVKNSWSEFWGFYGYIRIAMVEGAGICNIHAVPMQPRTD